LKIILSLVLLFSFCLNAQDITVFVKGSKSDDAVLYALMGENSAFIDSVKSVRKDYFRFSFDKTKRHPGFYRLLVSNKQATDFLYDGEAVNIETAESGSPDSLNVITSESNQLYYEFIKLNKSYRTKTELLKVILANYPRDDDFYQSARQKAAQLQKDYEQFVNVASQSRPYSFIARYIKSARLPVTDLNLMPDKQFLYLIANALNNVNFQDGGLIYSDLFTSKAIEYLSYYRNPKLTKDELEGEFIRAVDTVLSRAKVNQIVYQQLTEYLVNGFKRFGMEKTLDYIVSNYIIKDDICLDSKTEGMIERRISQAKNLPTGAIVPNFALPDTSGQIIDLYKIKSEKTLLIFYASWCPHCQEMLPEINKYYENRKAGELQIAYISLDNKRGDWTEFIRRNGLKMLNLSDQKGWDSKTCADYFIYATPTLFLLDRDKRILQKPLTTDELKKYPL